MRVLCSCLTLIAYCLVFNFTVQSQKGTENSLDWNYFSCNHSGASETKEWIDTYDSSLIEGFETDHKSKSCGIRWYNDSQISKAWSTVVADKNKWLYSDVSLELWHEGHPRDPNLPIDLKDPSIQFVSVRVHGGGTIHLPNAESQKELLETYCFKIGDNNNRSISSCKNQTSTSEDSNSQGIFNFKKDQLTVFNISWYTKPRGYEENHIRWIDLRHVFIDQLDKTRSGNRSYEYLWTKSIEQHLLWPNITSDSRHFSIVVMMKLCERCKAEFQLVDGANESLAQRTKIAGSRSMIDQFNVSVSPWHFVKLHADLKNKSLKYPIDLKMFTSAETGEDSPFWAVRPQIRLCETDDPSKCEENLECNLCKGMSVCEKGDCSNKCVPGFKGKSCDEGFCDGVNKKYDKKSGRCLEQCLANYLPPECQTRIEEPMVNCEEETELKITYANKTKKELYFTIKEIGGEKWKRLNKSEFTSDWKLSKKSINKNLALNKMYCIRAVEGHTKGPTARFDTSCWRPTMPEVLSAVPQNNGDLTIKWAHHREFWENTISFDFGYDYLDLEPTNGSKQTLTTSQPEMEYSDQLKLWNISNYKFHMRAIDAKQKHSDHVDIWYLVPDKLGLADVEQKQLSSTEKSIDVTLSNLGKPTWNYMVYIVMRNASTCPSVKQNQNSTIHTSKITPDKESKMAYSKRVDEHRNLSSGEYPACLLRWDETYVFTIATEDTRTSILIWLIIPIILAFLILSYVSYRKYKGAFMDSKSILENHSSNTQPNHYDGKCESSEIRRLRNFEDYVQSAAENGVLQQQFMRLPKGLVRPCECGRLSHNRSKNRYGNLIAYDETRVLLTRNSSAGYINANYIEGYSKSKAYIATQSPMRNTIVDFWEMIWQEEVHIICMLVNLREGKESICEQYWPDEVADMQYGDVIVSTTKHRVFPDYTYRTFLLTKQSEAGSLTVEHLQYTGWPREGVPMYSHSIVEYLNTLLSLPPGQGPVVVHCTAGTGRTGAVILSDIALRYLAAEGTVDLFAEAKKMFRCRANILTSLEQYVLAHLVPTQCLLLTIPTKVLCSDLNGQKIEELKNDLPAHMARLENTSWMDKALRPLEPIRPPHPENIEKNRFPKLTPVGPHLVTLTKYPTYDENSSYISAVSVDGAKLKKQFIASQLPMPSTRTDFWRLIVEKDIELIIILQDPDKEDETCCDIIPHGKTLVALPYLKVETKSISETNEYFTTDKLLLTDSSVSPVKRRTITALTCKNWSLEEDARPPNPEALVELWRASENIQRPEGQTLVLCHNGVTGCGLYLALSFVLDRMGADQECDVILAVKAIRRSRPEFVSSQWQFEYLYDAAMEYQRSYQDYDNFTRSASPNQYYE